MGFAIQSVREFTKRLLGHVCEVVLLARDGPAIHPPCASRLAPPVPVAHRGVDRICPLVGDGHWWCEALERG